MTAVWGSDRGRFDGFCLADAERAARLLVPVLDVRADRETAWSTALQAGDLDGQADWSRLTELPGAGGHDRAADCRPASGVLPAAFVASVHRALPAELRDALWHCEPWPVLTVAPGTPVRGPLEALLTAWPTFPGRVWAVDAGGRVAGTALSAPPYADSLVLSGPAAVVDAVLGSDLEAFPVDRWDPLPRMTT